MNETPKRRLLVACEYSGIVREAFKSAGWDAWSCDLLPTEQPGQHYQCDVREVLDQHWGRIIAFPPCTYLTNSAEWAYGDGPYHQKVKPETLTGAVRRIARIDAVEFFRMFLEVDCPEIAVENPIGCISRLIRPPDQIIQPHWFMEDAAKATCFWLKGLPNLIPTGYFPPRMVEGKPRWGNQTDSGQNRVGPREGRALERSKTYKGIAQAMADQWL